MVGRLPSSKSSGTVISNVYSKSDSVSHKTSDVKLDVITVGAGLSGLAAAISIALSGHQVAVFESATELLEASSLSTDLDQSIV